jgi:hypothetical protein
MESDQGVTILSRLKHFKEVEYTYNKRHYLHVLLYVQCIFLQKHTVNHKDGCYEPSCSGVHSMILKFITVGEFTDDRSAVATIPGDQVAIVDIPRVI